MRHSHYDIHCLFTHDRVSSQILPDFEQSHLRHCYVHFVVPVIFIIIFLVITSSFGGMLSTILSMIVVYIDITDMFFLNLWWAEILVSGLALSLCSWRCRSRWRCVNGFNLYHTDDHPQHYRLCRLHFFLVTMVYIIISVLGLIFAIVAFILIIVIVEFTLIVLMLIKDSLIVITIVVIIISGIFFIR